MLLCLLCACAEQKTDDGSGRDYPTDEAFDLIDRSMSYMDSDPSTAHRLLDSIADAGLMTRERRDYYHAMVVFSGECNYDSALAMCESLLNAGRFGDDRFLEEELCVLASNITSGSNNHLATLKFANRGIALCHGDERMRGDEITLIARVGEAEQRLGRTLQARASFDRAYQLLQGTHSFADLVSLITLQKKQIGMYRDIKDYDRIISICREIVQLVDRFDQDPSFVGQRPQTMQEPGPATRDFANFYRCQMYAHLAHTYRLRVEEGLAEDALAETDSVRSYLDRLLNTDGAQTSMALVNSMNELQFIGRKADFDRIRPMAEELYRNDTLVEGYVEFLKALANDAAARNDLKTSNSYMKRAMVVSDSIYQREQVRMLTEQMAINMVQEQQLARQDAESQLERQRLTNRLLTIILLTVLVASLTIGLLSYKNRKKEEIIRTTQQNLYDIKEEVKELTQQLEESKADRTADTSLLLYERIEKVMEVQELYLIDDLDIKMVAEAVNSSRAMTSACINRISGKTFRQWLSEYRLTLFLKMMRQDPEAQIDELLVRCGYKDQSTFRRQFKERYGMTALKYRNSILKGNSLRNHKPASTKAKNNNKITN